MRVLVCGGRDFTDQEYLTKVLWQVDTEVGGFSALIHGGCRGADWLAQIWACEDVPKEDITIRVQVFKANWQAHGNAAGPIRNRKMINEGNPELVLAFAGGKGTDDMCRRARTAGIEVRRYWPGKTTP